VMILRQCYAVVILDYSPFDPGNKRPRS
jgi:hypothetical protein